MDAKGRADDRGNGQRFPPRFAGESERREKGTPQKWVQCSYCKKWRQVGHTNDTDMRFEGWMGGWGRFLII